MKNIYKREPLVRSLPAGYDGLDAVNYTNLSGFKGLQVYDNPLIADPNSTYSCKNVYVDEHGNLTVRPALMTTQKLTTTVLWCHEYSDGTALKTEYIDNEYRLTVTNGTASDSIIFSNEPTVIPVESDGLYLFVKTEHNILYEIVDAKFELVEGTVLLDDAANSDIEHYNILNNKVINEINEAITGTPRDDSRYVIDFQVPLINNWDEPYRIIKGTNKWIICSQNLITIIENGSVKNVNVNTGYQLVPSDWCVQETTAGLEVTVAAYREKPNLSSLFDGSSYMDIKHIVIDADGNIVTNYTLTGNNSVHLFAGYGYAVAVLAHTGEPDDPNWSHFICYKKITGDSTDANDTTLEAFRNNDWTRIGDAVFRPVWFEPPNLGVDFSGSSGIYQWIIPTTRGIIITDYSFSTKTVDIRPYIGFDEEAYEAAVISTAYDTVPKTVRAYENIITSPSGDTFYYHVQNEVDETLSRIDGRIYFIRNGRITGSYIATHSPVSITDIHGYSQNIKFNLRDSDYIEYTFKFDVILADEDFVLKSQSAYYRIPGLTAHIVERDTSVIPVISDIAEEPITGFFLDNCWWFITEHSVFGTGVDGNGLATVKRFDPLKYFKFSEKLTGAIRLSDTSFWVFHNNGAYLIYKTSMTVLNQTEYRWLCTATAKSKGCDFENALVTLPVSSYVATVTNSDICTVQMRENIQSDERSLVPMTMSFASDIRQLLSETDSIKIVNYKYLTIFILNKIDEDGHTPAVVLDNATNSWWYWEFPVRYVSQAWQTETDTYLLCPHENIIVALNSEEYSYTIGSIVYAVYADRLDTNQSPTQIDWGWQSAMQVFGTVERRKQLLFTTFVFDDFMPTDSSEQTIELGYYFNIYSKNYATSKPDATTATIFRASNTANKTIISNFNYLQLVLCNMPFEDVNFEALTKPKICCISLKYRLLRGEWT